MGGHVVGWIFALRSPANYSCHSVLLLSQGESDENERGQSIFLLKFFFCIVILSALLRLGFIKKKFHFQVLTREKKKIRLAEQNRQQIVIPSQNSSNSLPRQSQTQKPQQSSTSNLNNAKDSGYGKDIKGRLNFYLIEFLLI